MLHARWRLSPCSVFCSLLIALGSSGCTYDWNPSHLPASNPDAQTDATLDAHGDVSRDGLDSSQDGADAPSCSGCTAAQECCANHCVNIDRDPDHCGACDTQCMGTTCNGG